MSDFNLDEWNNLGNILVRRGSISRRQLKIILAEQTRRTNLKIGDVAVELGYVSRDVIDAALAEQACYRLPEESQTSKDATSILTKALASVRLEVDKMQATNRRKRTAARGISILEISPIK